MSGRHRAAWKFGARFFEHAQHRGKMGLVLCGEVSAGEPEDDAPELDGRDVDLLARRGQINLVTWLDD